MAKLFVATKAFIEHDGKVLVLKESEKYKDGTNIGFYDVPGGRVRPGQKFDESLQREVMEEAGMKIRIGKPFFVNESWPEVRGEQWQVVRVFFRCEPLTKDVTLSNDHDAYAWIDPREYTKHKIIPNLAPAFKAYMEK